MESSITSTRCTKHQPFPTSKSCHLARPASSTTSPQNRLDRTTYVWWTFLLLLVPTNVLSHVGSVRADEQTQRHLKLQSSNGDNDPNEGLIPSSLRQIQFNDAVAKTRIAQQGPTRSDSIRGNDKSDLSNERNSLTRRGLIKHDSERSRGVTVEIDLHLEREETPATADEERETFIAQLSEETLVNPTSEFSNPSTSPSSPVRIKTANPSSAPIESIAKIESISISLDNVVEDEELVPSLPPSVEQSVSPSGGVISDAPSTLESEVPSPFPSLIPSFGPTTFPSDYPTKVPSDHPSSHPSPLPSSAPSRPPSPRPSTAPSTASPSHSPTMRPSIAPSASPTLSCHDNAVYRNPLNDLLSCAHHRGTPCESWYHLGLTDYEVVELIENCPVACGIPCGTYSGFVSDPVEPSFSPTQAPSTVFIDMESSIQFYISSLSGSMNASIQIAFEDLTQDFLEQNALATDQPYEIKDVTLTAQQLLDTRDRQLLRRSDLSMLKSGRRSLAGGSTLEVTTLVTLRAWNVGITSIHRKLIDLFGSPEYASTLRSNDFFADASVYPSVSSLSDPQQLISEAQPGPRRGNSLLDSAVLLMSLSFFVVGGVILGVYLRRRSKRNGAPPEISDTFKSFVNSFGHHDSESKQGSMFSLEESPYGSRTSVHQSIAHSGLLGHSEGSTSSDSGSSQASALFRPLPIPKRKSVNKITVTSSETESDRIPPMIVFDNIDQEAEKGVESHDKRSARQSQGSEGKFWGEDEDIRINRMEIKRMSASTDLVSSISNRERPLTLADMLNNIGCDVDCIKTSSPVAISVRAASKRLVDGDSVSSTPARIMPLDHETESLHRKSLSSGVLIQISSSEALDEIIRSEWHTLGLGQPGELSKRQNPPKKTTAVVHKSTYRPSLKINTELPTNVPPSRKPLADAATTNPLGNLGTIASTPEDSEALTLYENDEGSLSVDTSRKQQRRKSTGSGDDGKRADQNPDSTSSPQNRLLNSCRNRSYSADDVQDPDRTIDLSERVTADAVNLSIYTERAHSTTNYSPPVDEQHVETVGMQSPSESTCGEDGERVLSPPHLAFEKDDNDDNDDGNSEHLNYNRLEDSTMSTPPSELKTCVLKTLGFRYEFDTPIDCKLGILIESGSRDGPTVNMVKDYSPLFGMVHAGDAIVAVDNEETRHMTTTQLTKLLTWKRSQKEAGIIRISFLSTEEKQGLCYTGIETMEEVPPIRQARGLSKGVAAGDSSNALDDSVSVETDQLHLLGGMPLSDDHSWNAALDRTPERTTSERNPCAEC